MLHGTYCVSTPLSNSPVEDFSDVYSQNAAYRSWGLASGTEENTYWYYRILYVSSCIALMKTQDVGTSQQ